MFQNHQKLYQVVTGLLRTTQFLSALRASHILWIDLLIVLQRRQSTQHRRDSWIVMSMLLDLTTLDSTRSHIVLTAQWAPDHDPLYFGGRCQRDEPKILPQNIKFFRIIA